MIEFSTRMTGLAELEKRLKELPKEVQDKPIKAGLRGAAKVLKDEIIATAPHDDETPDGVHISENVQIARSRRRSGPDVEVVTVGIRYGSRVDGDGKKRKTEGAAWYWKLIEFGTSRIAADPFMRDAFKAKRQAMVDAFLKRFEAGVKRLERKYGGLK